MISLGNIVGITALIGLVVPVIIHLLSKKTRKSIKFGSLRFIESSETKTLKSLRINDIWILILRGLILTALALFLSNPLWQRKTTGDSLYIVDCEYATNPALNSLLDSLPENSEVRWLTEELNELEDTLSLTPISWTSLREKTFNYEEVILISPLKLCDVPEYFDGNLNVSRIIKFPEEFEKGVFTDSKINFRYSENHFKYEPDNIKRTVLYSIDYDKEFSILEKIVSSSISAANKYGRVSFEKTQDLDSADWVFWLKNNSPPRLNKIVKPGYTSGESFETFYNNIIHLNTNLNYQSAMDNNFAESFIMELSGPLGPNPDRVLSFPLQQLQLAERQKSTTQYMEEASIGNLFLILAAGLFFIERLSSFLRNHD